MAKREPTREIPFRIDDRGTIRATSYMTPKSCTTRARISVPPNKVIPVIVVPGIMGSNLRAKTRGGPRNEYLKPGEAAWRPPNGIRAGLRERETWEARDGTLRQLILSGPTLDVDDSGEIQISPHSDSRANSVSLARERGWGEVHADSYGKLLSNLHNYLNSTFSMVDGRCALSTHWVHINNYDRSHWGENGADASKPLSEAELTAFAEYHYPVYACGYNWLESNDLSAKRLRARIESLIASWQALGKKCEQVILVTHSMGGLVARACAKAIPEKIKGVIHGVMPALGAPACYRRIACGTEISSPSNGMAANTAMEAFSIIAGATAAETTPVMAYAAGPLELLPNHMYPKPWLFASQHEGNNRRHDLLQLPYGSPYDIYRDFHSWFRLFDISLADPANIHKGHVVEKLRFTIDVAEQFHRNLGDYYHPNTYAFYCDDRAFLSFGSCRWTVKSGMTAIASLEMQHAKLLSHSADGIRNVMLATGRNLVMKIEAQEAAGDGTVPALSGAGPANKVKHLFRVRGVDHQGSYNAESILRLTLHLMVKIVSAS
jgi:pimeloyl-ACP methyl ester carboxylesterase